MPGKWMFTDPHIGVQPIANAETTKNQPLGTIRRATYTGYSSASNNYGAGEFIYLAGAASTVVGSLVVYNPIGGTTTLAPNTANLNQPVAVAMAATGSGQYGWYQISGAAVIKKTGVPVSPSVPVYLSGTAGRVKSTAASGKQVVNGRSVNAATVAAGTSSVVVLIQRPHTQGAVA